MEEVAQGRVWAGKDAASRGLVDAIGGLSRAVAIAKQKANIPLNRKVSSSYNLFICTFVFIISTGTNHLCEVMQPSS